MRFPRILMGLIISFIVLVSACTTEIQLARTISKDKSKISVLCDFPDFIILTNSMVEIPEGLSEQQLADFYDSLYANSNYIQYIDDTLFLRQFRENVKAEFQSIGLNYFEEGDINQFLSAQGTRYLVNFKQLELEERWESYHDEEVFGEILYEEDFWIQGLSLNAWMHVAKVNDTVEIQRQLYHESVIKDEVDGMFFQNNWNGKVHYQYRLDTLKVKDIGDLEYQSAEEFSYFLFNYMVNKEIRDRLNYIQQAEPVYDWYLRPGSRRLIPEEMR